MPEPRRDEERFSGGHHDVQDSYVARMIKIEIAVASSAEGFNRVLESIAMAP